MAGIYTSRVWAVFGFFVIVCAMSIGQVQGCLDDPDGQCDEGWSLVPGGNCVIIPKVKANYNKAKAACVRKGGMLVVLDTISDKRSCLLGLHPHKKYRMVWVTSSKGCKLHDLASTSNRSPGCQKKRFYACQKEAVVPTKEVPTTTTTEETTTTTTTPTTTTTIPTTTPTTTTTTTSTTTTQSTSTTTEYEPTTTEDMRTDTMHRSSTDTASLTDYDTHSVPALSSTSRVNQYSTDFPDTDSVPVFGTTQTTKDFSAETSDTESVPALATSSSMDRSSAGHIRDTTQAVSAEKTTDDYSIESTTRGENFPYEPKVNITEYIGFTIIGADDAGDKMKTTSTSTSDIDNQNTDSTTESMDTKTTVAPRKGSPEVEEGDSHQAPVLPKCQQSPLTLKCPQDWIAFNNTICLHINEQSTGDHSEAADDCIDKKGELATETDLSEGILECLSETYKMPKVSLRLAGGKCVNLSEKSITVCASDLDIGHICAIHQEPSAGESVQGVDAAPVAGMTLAATSVAIIVYHTLKTRMSS